MTARQADLALLLCTLIWASTFVVVKDAMEDVSPLLYIAARMAVATVLLVLVRRSLLAEARTRGALLHGAGLGGCLFFGMALQTIGLGLTTPARSAFITSLAVVLVPFLDAALTRRAPPGSVLAALPVSVLGLALLADPWSRESPYPPVLGKLNAGDLWNLASTGFFAFQLILSERAATRATASALAFVQVVVCGALALVATVAFEASGLLWPLRAHFTPAVALSLTVTSFLATCVCFLLWLSAQKTTTAARAALIFTLEPVFASALSRALGRESLSGTQYAGGALVVLAILLAELRHFMKGGVTSSRCRRAPRRGPP